MNDHTEINWVTASFLLGTLLLSAVTVPLYVWKLGIGPLEIGLFVTMFFATGLAITVGYHRLFTHCTFRASWPVRLALSLFGAAAFESSALVWSSEHRYHHKYTDLDGNPRDPHSIAKGFWWAHIGWLLTPVVPLMERDNIEDLRRDPILVWQDRYFVPLAVAMGFVFPSLVGGAISWALGNGFLVGLAGGFVFGACLRIVVVHHATFLINSATHTFGRQPYDSSNSSRDSGLLALVTFGEGYHNFHHAFPGDYRIGSRAWHFDPGKWSIWLLNRLGLVSNLRRLPKETIQLARIRESRRRLEQRLDSLQPQLREQLVAALTEIEERMHELHLHVRQLLSEKSRLARQRGSARRAEIERQLAAFSRDFQDLVQQWYLQRRQLLLSAAA